MVRVPKCVRKGHTPIVSFVDRLVASGRRCGIGAILHLKPVADGRLEVMIQEGTIFNHAGYVPSQIAVMVITRLKIMSNCHFADRKMCPQYGETHTVTKIRTYGTIRFEVFVIPHESGKEGVIIQFAD